MPVAKEIAGMEIRSKDKGCGEMALATNRFTLERLATVHA